MGVSKNNGTPKSSILIGFSIIHHPLWGTPIFGNTHIKFDLHFLNSKIFGIFHHFFLAEFLGKDSEPRVREGLQRRTSHLVAWWVGGLVRLVGWCNMGGVMTRSDLATPTWF